MRWIKSLGVDVYKTRLEVYAQDYRGVHATVDIKLGEEVMLIRINETITMNALKEMEIGKILEEKKAVDPNYAQYVYIVIYLLEEQFYNKNSRIKPYLDIVPSITSGHPMYLTEKEKEYMKGSNALGKRDSE